MADIMTVAHMMFAKVGVLGFVALWVLKAGVGWIALRWLRRRTTG